MNPDLEKLTNSYLNLKGQRGIVTGGSAGLGKRTALMLANAGAVVFVVSRSGRFKEGNEEHKNIIHVKADVTDSDRMKQVVDEAGEEGLDFLVNNAASSFRQRINEVEMQRWKDIQDANLNAVMIISRYAFKYLTKSKNKGRIVNLASMAAHLAFTEVVPYTVMKTAILGLTRGLAVEWVNDNILVNSVSPGWIKTGMLNNVLDKERERKILNKIAMHEYGSPEDIAAMIWYLVSPAAKYITGQDFVVDGGALAYGY